MKVLLISLLASWIVSQLIKVMFFGTEIGECRVRNVARTVLIFICLAPLLYLVSRV
jgi:hypothetical protein